MEKRIMIEGMACGHCTSAVEKALNNIDDISYVEVRLSDKCAVVRGEALADEALRAAVEGVGFEVVDII